MTIQQAFELALQHHQAGRLGEAETVYRQLLAVEPRHADALHYLGVIAHQVGRYDVAVELIRQATALNPNSPDAQSNLGTVLRINGQLDESITACRRAIAFRPNYPETRSNLGNVLKDKGQLDEAIAAYRQAIALEPNDSGPHNNLGTLLRVVGSLDEAMACYRRAIDLSPHSTLVHSNILVALHYCPQTTLPVLFQAHHEYDRRHAAPLRGAWRDHPNTPDPERRLKVGYVSPDFRHNVIGHFLMPLLEAHDHTQFEVHCYAGVERPDPITERFRKTADVWRDVRGLGDEALAGQIREDTIDILIDLSQHTAGNRLSVFARKPAPLQVAWLGHPWSTGLRAIDYRLTDAYMEPVGSAWSESVEEPVRLPDSWFCYDPLDQYPEPGELPALRFRYVTFGCLNSFSKVNEAVLQRWIGVLRNVEGSRLMLRCPEGGAQARVRRFFEERGIGADRLELVGWIATRDEYLHLFERMDIALDPFPYNGGTTTCDTLWMGVPVLTLPGEMVVARIGLSILSAAGLPEFVAHSEADYLRLAVSLASDLPRLAALRPTLRERMKVSAFMDGPRFARNVERVYRQMWREWCAKQRGPQGS